MATRDLNYGGFLAWNFLICSEAWSWLSDVGKPLWFLYISVSPSGEYTVGLEAAYNASPFPSSDTPLPYLI